MTNPATAPGKDEPFRRAEAYRYIEIAPTSENKKSNPMRLTTFTQASILDVTLTDSSGKTLGQKFICDFQ